MSFALILSICAPLVTGEPNADECVDYIVKTYDTPAQCVAAMDRNVQHRDDRYLSCASGDYSHLVDKTNGRTAEQIISDLNKY